MRIVERTHPAYPVRNPIYRRPSERESKEISFQENLLRRLGQ